MGLSSITPWVREVKAHEALSGVEADPHDFEKLIAEAEQLADPGERGRVLSFRIRDFIGVELLEAGRFEMRSPAKERVTDALRIALLLDGHLPLDAHGHAGNGEAAKGEPLRLIVGP